MFIFISTYTTFASSKSPNIKCLGRLSTILVVDIRRARVAVAVEASLLANETEPRRSPNQVFKYILGIIEYKKTRKSNNMNAPDGFEGVVIVS